jgi:hypothetical protein
MFSCGLDIQLCIRQCTAARSTFSSAFKEVSFSMFSCMLDIQLCIRQCTAMRSTFSSGFKTGGPSMLSCWLNIQLCIRQYTFSSAFKNGHSICSSTLDIQNQFDVRHSKQVEIVSNKLWCCDPELPFLCFIELDVISLFTYVTSLGIVTSLGCKSNWIFRSEKTIVLKRNLTEWKVKFRLEY